MTHFIYKGYINVCILIKVIKNRKYFFEVYKLDFLTRVIQSTRAGDLSSAVWPKMIK